MFCEYVFLSHKEKQVDGSANSIPLSHQMGWGWGGILKQNISLCGQKLIKEKCQPRQPGHSWRQQKPRILALILTWTNHSTWHSFPHLSSVEGLVSSMKIKTLSFSLMHSQFLGQRGSHSRFSINIYFVLPFLKLYGRWKINIFDQFSKDIILFLTQNELKRILATLQRKDNCCNRHPRIDFQPADG